MWRPKRVGTVWHQFAIRDGLYQGCSWSALLFCLAMCAVDRRFRIRLRRDGRHATLLLYMYDILVCQSSVLPAVIRAVEEALAEVGLPLKCKKCSAFCAGRQRLSAQRSQNCRMSRSGVASKCLEGCCRRIFSSAICWDAACCTASHSQESSPCLPDV